MVRVKRSMPAPESLEIEKNKASGSYEKTDVVERLRKDFHNKCYICEMDNLQDPQVEHLRPHFNGKNIDLKFDWNNLFWSCGYRAIVHVNAIFTINNPPFFIRRLWQFRRQFQLITKPGTWAWHVYFKYQLKAVAKETALFPRRIILCPSPSTS